MDGTDFIFIGILLALLASPFVLITFIFSCIAYHRTREWEREKAARFSGLTLDDVEGQNLVPKNTARAGEYDGDDAASDVESLDSEEEAEILAKEAEKEADWSLTKGQKFRKELRKAWKGRSPSDLEKERDRAEAAKIAKAVAKGIERHERRRERRAARKAQQNSLGNGESSNSSGTVDDASGLPSYSNAVAASGDRKE